MQLIDHFKTTWTKPVTTKDRFLFSLVLLVLMVLYYYARYIKHAVPYASYQNEVYAILGFLVSFVIIDFWGNFILRVWLSVSGLIGQTVFFILLFIVYYVVLSPIFLLVNLFKRKEQVSSNWANKLYANNDYQTMG